MSYLIPSYHLIIEEEDLKELRNDIWNDFPVPAHLKVENRLYDIDIAYRGSILEHFVKDPI